MLWGWLREIIAFTIIKTPTNQQGDNMSIIQYEPVHIGDFSSFIENLVSKTKSKRFRAGFIKTDGSYRYGRFDFKYRKTW